MKPVPTSPAPKSPSMSPVSTPMLRQVAPLPFMALNGALKAAGEATRLRILALLAEAELTVSDLTDILRQSQPRISRHLKLLADAGLVERFREGSWAFFRLGEHGGSAELARELICRLDANDATIARDRERLAAVRAERAAAAQAYFREHAARAGAKIEQRAKRCAGERRMNLGLDGFIGHVQPADAVPLRRVAAEVGLRGGGPLHPYGGEPLAIAGDGHVA